jgi:hypothetical protein
MRHSPVRIDKGAGDGTQPAPTSPPADAIAPIWLSRARPAPLHSRITAWLLLPLVFLALCVVRLVAGDPFEDDEF